MRRIATLAALAVPGLLAAGLGAPGALAADDCANAAVRAQQHAERLPNCLAYEKVSPDDKNGAPPGLLAVTADGDAALFALNSGTGTPLNFHSPVPYRATRTEGGWGFAALSTPFSGRFPTSTEGLTTAGWSEGLDRLLIQTSYPLSPNDQGNNTRTGAGSQDVYLLEADGSTEWIVRDPSQVDTTTLAVTLLDYSSDLSRIAVSSPRPLHPDVTTTNLSHVYVWTRAGMHLATVLPNGNLPTSLPATDGTAPTRLVSADGRRVAFKVGTGAAGRVYVRFDADTDTGVTRESASGPNGETCEMSRLLGLSDDGSKLIFQCGNAIISGAPEYGFYVRDLDGGPAAVHRIGAAPTADVIGATPDFSRIYLRVGATRLALSKDGGPMEDVAVPLSGSSSINRSGVSRNGEYFVWSSSNEYGFDRGGSGSTQVYRYSAQTGELTCVSCRTDGTPSTADAGIDLGVANAVSAPNPGRAVSDAGTVTFSAVDDLDPRDTNGVLDAYAWIDGRPVLLSDGRNREPSASLGSTPDGRSFFVASAAALVRDDADGGGYDIYAVRPNGGFAVPDAPAECTVTCQTAAGERPPVPGLGSQSFVGRGNLVEETTAPPKPRASASLSASKSVRGKSITVRVKVSGAGSVRVSGVGLRQVTVKAKKAGTHRVTVRLSAFGVKQQKRRGRLTTRLTARFTPTSGASKSVRKSVTFTAPKKGGR